METKPVRHLSILRDRSSVRLCPWLKVSSSSRRHAEHSWSRNANAKQSNPTTRYWAHQNRTVNLKERHPSISSASTQSTTQAVISATKCSAAILRTKYSSRHRRSRLATLRRVYQKHRTNRLSLKSFHPRLKRWHPRRCLATSIFPTCLSMRIGGLKLSNPWQTSSCLNSSNRTYEVIWLINDRINCNLYIN